MLMMSVRAWSCLFKNTCRQRYGMAVETTRKGFFLCNRRPVSSGSSVSTVTDATRTDRGRPQGMAKAERRGELIQGSGP
jgi:hypothetical protein